MKFSKYLKDTEAKILGLTVKENEKGRSNARYSVNDAEWNRILSIRNKGNNQEETSSSSTKGYDETFVLSAWNQETGKMMNIDTYCEHYLLPRQDITSYKLVSHTGKPYYNIVFKENLEEAVFDFDIEEIIQKHIKPTPIKKSKVFNCTNDFDSLTYTDVHIGMDTNADNNSMYAIEWNRDVILNTAHIMVEKTIREQTSNILYIDELGDFLDGFNGQTTRGGHALPQNMTNEEAFDCALEFKMIMVDSLVPFYDKIVFNNICNDNHAGAFGYFANSAFKQIVARKYPEVEVNNYRQFINHYYVGNICFLITHGKDEKTLKFGFKPFLDPRGSEKIDQYCKQNNIYKNSELIIFKKGDSHQALFDMCTSDDFYYYNYPALSPGSQWVTTNFKLGRRGFVNESFKGLDSTMKIKFIKQ